MNSLPIYLRIRSEYFEADSSRYRLALTQNILCQSLRHQTDPEFMVLLAQSPMDPFWTKRKNSFQSRDAEEPTGQRIEVEVGDDDFLCPTFIETIRKIPLQQKNSFLVFQNGYIFHEGKLMVWRGRDDLVVVTMMIDPGAHVGETVEATSNPSWIYCRHQMNSIVVPDEMLQGARVNGLKWAGWKENIVARYCKTAVKTATANGCELHPTKSKSAIFAKGSARNRRR